jgi:SAM-dependent methyltransferase
VGCNAGFFCGWAAFQEASFVRGIDINPSFIEEAKALFPECSFLHQSWEQLGPERYDCIFCLSAIQYAEDQQALLDKLVERLAPDGLLVLELGVAPGAGDAFVPVRRSIDTRLFPTAEKLRSMLSAHTYKYIGPSVPQVGDPIPRSVYHVRRAKPRAALFLDNPNSGKSNTVATLLNPAILRIAGDKLLEQVVQGALAAPEKLRPLIQPVPGTNRFNGCAIINAICAAGLLPELAAFFTEPAQGRDFVLDAYIPADYREQFSAIVEKAGYFVVEVSLRAARVPDWVRGRVPPERAFAYLDHLEQREDFDEEAYLAANPDVAEAVAKGKIVSGRRHYRYFGKRENRPLRPTDATPDRFSSGK